MSIVLYGIPNCDTVKKARGWLAEHGVEYVFHDFKKQGLPPAKLDRWMQAVGHAKLLNRQGMTWRRLDAQQQASAADPSGARALMLAQPSILKRPVIEWDAASVTVGFDAADWALRAGR